MLPETHGLDRPRLVPSVRFVLALLVSFSLFVQYAQRISLSMGIVCMVNRTNINMASRGNSSNIRIFSQKASYGSEFLTEKKFFWSELQQQLVLGGHWFGYILALAPGGWLSIKFGAKKTFAACLFISSTVTSLMAMLYFTNDYHFIGAIILRVIAGLGHGPLFPATYTFWSMWAVPFERSTLTAIGFCSTNLGTSITMLFGGLFCRYVISGWVYIFLLTGLFGFIWLILWMWLVTDSPLTNPRISDKECQYICDKIGIDMKSGKHRGHDMPPLPWKKALRSKPLIALVVSQSCNLLGLFFFYTNVAKILTEIHRVPTQYAGYVLAGGFLLMPISSLSSGIIADRLVRSKKMSLTNVRKIFNSIASFIPAICVIVLCFCDHNRQLLGVIAILVFLFSSAAAYGSGYVVNFADVVPAYSSIVFAVAGSLGTAGALGANILAGFVIKRPALEHWRKLFIFFAILHIIGGLVFVLFGSAVARKWATFKSQKTETDLAKENGESTKMLPSQQLPTSIEAKDKELNLA